MHNNYFHLFYYIYADVYTVYHFNTIKYLI